MIKFESLAIAVIGFIAIVSNPMSRVVAADIGNPQYGGRINVTSWKALRDFKVVKQELDYSCGAASLATVFNSFYGMATTEKELLDSIGKDGKASFEDMAAVAPQYGFKGAGLALSFQDLKQLKIPAIAYLKYRGEDHFTVIRGIRLDGVVNLGDPSWGNRQLTEHQFRSMWETREDPKARGKILLLVPLNIQTTKINETFFSPPKGWRLALETIPLSP
ncbi:C39 family peptidase [Agrobacterium sp. ST15.13.015]|uniref:C39 family peptidase n=1 Tax=Agrobacterium sp. ST15.13.015 TaxID=3017319 RepID=UPI0022BE738E|nr:cysteine peptidase family C39 domain-containing protein [Agrobacterium sp. ST15.13.015]MCZ7501301.1 cysteine peptidase family C39 domain-containing protein [Rhizobium rhizogenes]